jgi:F-type H+-transporting ATPase subunit a
MPEQQSLSQTETGRPMELAWAGTEGGHAAPAKAHGSADGHAAGAHAAGDGHGGQILAPHPPEPPTFISALYEIRKAKVDSGELPHDDATYKTLKAIYYGPLDKPAPIINNAPWTPVIMFVIASALTIGLAVAATGSYRRNRQEALRRPTRTQIAIEAFVEALEGFICGILGPENGRRYLPFLGSMFIFIMIANLQGLVPLLAPPTASFLVTITLGLATFTVVQFTAMTKLGPLKYLYHLAGEPKGAIGWCMVPLFLPLEIIGTLSKPVSLALRLFGNMLGKDILFGAFLGMGIGLVGAFSKELSHFIGIPFTIPFYALGILFSIIQALVFTVLSCIYVLMVLPHDHSHDDHGDDHGHGHGPEAAHAH